MATDDAAIARPRLLVVTAMMLEALYDRAAVPVLSTLKPADMRSGGARVPGTSYELPADTAARAMQGLLALRGGSADALLNALAEADVAARFAALTGKPPPAVSSLYMHCTPDLAAAGSQSTRSALQRLYAAAQNLFTLTQMRRIDAQIARWDEHPEELDAAPVQQYVARFVRNAPP